MDGFSRSISRLNWRNDKHIIGRKEREQLFGELRDFTDSVKDHEEFQYLQSDTPQSKPNDQPSDSNKIKELVAKGYSQEVAEALIESQK